MPEEDCQCHNPFVASTHEDLEGWHNAFEMNTKQINETLRKETSFDLVLYGDSHIERLVGRQLGEYPAELKPLAKITQEIFTKQGGGKLEAHPLGIAGDEVRFHFCFRGFSSFDRNLPGLNGFHNIFLCLKLPWIYIYIYISDTHAFVPIKKRRNARILETICLVGNDWNERPHS